MYVDIEISNVFILNKHFFYSFSFFSMLDLPLVAMPAELWHCPSMHDLPLVAMRYHVEQWHCLPMHDLPLVAMR